MIGILGEILSNESLAITIATDEGSLVITLSEPGKFSAGLMPVPSDFMKIEDIEVPEDIVDRILQTARLYAEYVELNDEYSKAKKKYDQACNERRLTGDMLTGQLMVESQLNQRAMNIYNQAESALQRAKQSTKLPDETKKRVLALFTS